MIAPMDPQTRQFYVEMGYSEQQVTRAYEYSIRNKIDILDVLAQIQTSAQPTNPASQKQQATAPQPRPSAPLPNTSFLVPMAQVKVGEYETLFSRSARFNPLGARAELREPNNPVGLLNISNCCYLNSLLQCYFHMDKFKEILLAADPLDDIEEVLADNRTKLKRVKGEYELLNKLKKFFTVMSLTSKKYLDPSDVLQNLVDSVGQKLTYGQQKDLSEINIMIIERLSQGLTFSKKYFSQPDPSPRSSFIEEGEARGKYTSIFNPEGGVIKQLFYGTKAEYYSQKQMEKEEPIVSDFAGIILNPRFGTLQNALDEEFNFTVEIKGEIFEKKMFIRQQPQYLFLYINRTQYDREQQQLHKNEQSFQFDFRLYLDRYLEKYKQDRGQKDQRIRQLINLRNKVKQQISSLQILYKKIQECFSYAKQLEGWVNKLPTQDDFIVEGEKLKKQLSVIQHELQQVESRKEEYHLAYIFVHRGDAISGHYWGYGRNGSNWYRFDINCRLIPQDLILLDMQKSSGTPYALLYVKSQNIPKLKYNYYTKLGDEAGYNKLFDQKLATQIIRDNIFLHQEVYSKNYQIIKKKCIADYVARYNALKKIVKKISKPKAEQRQLDKIPLCDNFSLFLYSKQEMELLKFTLFQQSLLAASNGKLTIDRLMKESDLLATIQKKFKMKCKGELHLKNYAMVGKDLQKYLRLHDEFRLTQLQTAFLENILSSFQEIHDAIEKLNLKGEFVNIEFKNWLATQFCILMRTIRFRNIFLRSQEYDNIQGQLQQSLYITQVINEITKITMLSLAFAGFKFQSLQTFIDMTDPICDQIAIINSANVLSYPAFQPIRSIAEQVQGFIKFRFYFKQSFAQSSSKLEGKSSSRKDSNLDQSSSSSPFKSGAFKNREKQTSDYRLTAFSKNSIFSLDIRDTWKIEQLDSIISSKNIQAGIMAFLKRVGVVIKIYKKTIELGRALSLKQLSEEGIYLNQPKSQPESLI